MNYRFKSLAVIVGSALVLCLNGASQAQLATGAQRSASPSSPASPSPATPAPQAGVTTGTSAAVTVDRSVNQAPNGPPQLPESATSQRELRIDSGDLLQVTIFGVQDFNQEARVSATGEIILPLIGAVKVKGMTPEQAEADIRKRLMDGGYYRDPQVTVLAKEYATQGISVLGEVNKPGVYPRLGQRRLFDVISAAGGLSPKAGKLVTITHRDSPQNPIQVEMSRDPNQSMASNVEVFPGDTVIVSTAGVVYVVGEVNKPAGFIMDNNEKLTVLQAVALAGGTTNVASLQKARLIRKSSAGVQEIPVPLKNILDAKATDLPLQSGDILFVPGSASKGFGRRGLEAIIQAATGVAIYHP
jgi:polysaccharide export outer membrane protein